MKKSFFILILCLSSTQAGYIKGFIMSENLDTLAGANISISNLQLGTASMSDGSFILEGLDIGKYTINVNYIGYKQTSLTFYISEFSATDTTYDSEFLKKMEIESINNDDKILKAPFHDNITILLIADPLGIEEITVAASKVKQKINKAPSVVSLLNERTIRRNVGVDDFNRLASFLKGVDVTYFGVQGAQINARGFDGAYSTRFRQYEDGIYLGELVTGQVYSQIVGPPKESISKIEVLFGPQSALYGPDATQGLLNILKKHPRNDYTNEINISASSLEKYRLGGRYSQVYDQFAFDMVFELASAKELEYGNTNGKNPPIFYATDENDDGDYDDLGIDGTWESDTLRSDYYSNMDQKRMSLRTNLYYSLPNKSELSIALKNIYGQGYAMGSVGPMYTISNYTHTISTKYLSNNHAFRYTLLSQNQSTIPRQNLARFEVDNPELSWDDAVEGFRLDSLYWNLELNSLDHYLDYQWNYKPSSRIQMVAGFDYELKDPYTNRTALMDDGYDYFSRKMAGEDITEYRYGIYGQLMTDLIPYFDLTASVRFDGHEFYGDMISPRLAFVHDGFLNGSIKFITGRGFKVPSLTERNLYSGIVDAAGGTYPFPWKVQGVAMGNNKGFTKYDFYDIGNGQWDIYEPYIDANYGIVGEGNPISSIDFCEYIGGSYYPEYNTCGNGIYDYIDYNQNGVQDPGEEEPWWEMDGNGIYNSGDILIDSTYIQPLKVEEFTSFEVAYMGMLNKSTLIDINAYYGIYENFKTPLKLLGITGPFFLNDDLRTAHPFSIRQINRGNEIIGGHFINNPDEYVYVQTYESMPIEINFYGFDLGFKHLNENYEFSGNFSYFDDSDLKDKRDKAEKYYKYLVNPDSLEYYSSYEKFKNFDKVYSNTSNFKYSFSLTLIEPIIDYMDISLMIKGNTPYDFLSGVFQATKEGEGDIYDPLEGYKVDAGQVGGGVYVDLNISYKIDYYTSIGFGIKNVFESSTVSFPMSPSIPRSFVLELGYKF